MRRNIILCLCLWFLSGLLTYAQEPAQPPQPAQTAPAQPVVKQQPAPPKPSAAETYETSDGAVSLGLFYWLNPAAAGIRTGKTATATAPSVFNFPKNDNGAPGVVLSFPAGRYHTVRLSYFRTQAQGNKTIDNDINLFGADYLKGQLVSSSYTLQSAKISVDYTSWPFPVNNSRVRVKTFWEVQYTTMRAATDAPLEPTQDADGNFINHSGGKTAWFLYPTFGLGAEYFISRHFRFETKGSGFYFPGRGNTWDADAAFAYRQGQWEINFGGRAFHFKTSPKNEEFYKGTLPGAFVGMRWYPK